MKAKAVNPNYKWVMAAICFITIMIALGLCSSSKALFLKPITDGLGIPRGLFSITDTVRYATTALVNLVFATLVAKMGAKRMMILGVISLVVSMLLYSFAPAGGSVLTYGAVYSAGFFLGLGLAWCTTTMIGYVVVICIGSFVRWRRGSWAGRLTKGNAAE